MLAELCVLVTRPLGQGQALCEAIESRAGKTVQIPLIEISPLEQAEQIQTLKGRIQNLDNYHILIFISSNAASYGADWINDYWPQFPVGVEVIAIGPTTAETVSSLLGCQVISSDSGMSSEDLLALPVLVDVAEKRIAIVRGLGGRELLAQSLRNRSAQVEYLEVYQRRPIAIQVEDFRRELTEHSVNVLTITSSESLHNLLDALGDNKAEMSLLPLLVPSQRVAQQARQAGFEKVVNAEGADVAAFIAALESLVVNSPDN